MRRRGLVVGACFLAVTVVGFALAQPSGPLRPDQFITFGWIWSAGQAVQPFTIPSCTGNITPDGSSANDYICNLVGNITLKNPTRVVAGYTMNFTFIQPSSGGPYSLTTAHNSGGGTDYLYQGSIGPTLSGNPNAIDYLSCRTYAANTIVCGGLLANVGNP
jgi:hypothetical protein